MGNEHESANDVVPSHSLRTGKVETTKVLPMVHNRVKSLPSCWVHMVAYGITKESAMLLQVFLGQMEVSAIVIT